MAARLPALRDDHVHATSDCAPGLLGAADRVHDEPSGVVHHLDVALWIALEERDDPQARRKSLIDATVLIRVQREVAAKRTIGQRRRFTDHSSRVIHPPQLRGTKRASI